MRGLIATLRAAAADALSKRGAFISQLVIMVLNDLVWVVFWVLFFRRVNSLRGWNIELMLLLQSCLTTAGGLALGLMSNARHIGPMTQNGQLDSILALPTPALGHLLLRRIDPVHLGDVGFGVALFVVVGHPTPVRVAIFAFVVACAAVVTVGFLVLTGSLAPCSSPRFPPVWCSISSSAMRSPWLRPRPPSVSAEQPSSHAGLRRYTSGSLWTHR